MQFRNFIFHKFLYFIFVINFPLVLLTACSGSATSSVTAPLEIVITTTPVPGTLPGGSDAKGSYDRAFVRGQVLKSKSGYTVQGYFGSVSSITSSGYLTSGGVNE